MSRNPSVSMSERNYAGVERYQSLMGYAKTAEALNDIVSSFINLMNKCDAMAFSAEMAEMDRDNTIHKTMVSEGDKDLIDRLCAYYLEEHGNKQLDSWPIFFPMFLIPKLIHDGIPAHMEKNGISMEDLPE